MRPSSKRVLSIGIAALFLIGTLFVYGSLIKPAYLDIEKMRGELNAKENLFNSQKNATEQVNKAFTDMKTSAKSREVISQAIPVGPNMTQALHQVESVVRANKVTIEALTIKEDSPEPNKQLLAKRLGKLELNFSVSGSYESVRDFVRSLEGNARIANIESFVLSGNSEESKTKGGIYTLQIVAKMYYQES